MMNFLSVVNNSQRPALYNKKVDIKIKGMNKMNEIIQKQRDFFNSGITHNYRFRLDNLNRLHNMITAHEDMICDALYHDLHKSYYESFETEVGTVLTEITYLKKHLRRLMRPQIKNTPLSQFSSHSFVYPRPYGVVLNVSPWNYPFQLALSPLAGSIASGNCTIIKPSEYAPHTAKVITQLLSETFDLAYVKCVEGDHHVVEELIAAAPDYLFFTGSPATGKKIMTQAAANLVPITLELGGKSPCIIDESANINIAAKRIVWGKFMNAGQTCIAPDYLIVHQKVKQKLIDALINDITTMYSDTPLESPLYPHIVNEKQYLRLKQLFVQTTKANEKVDFIGPAFDDDQHIIAPTLIPEATFASPFMQEEIFGPVLPIITYENLDEIIKKLQQMEHPLALYVFSKKRKHIKRITRSISFGGGCINDVVSQFASDDLPFGGVGNSGMGHYHGKYSFETMTHYQAILKKNNWFDLPWKYLNHQNIKILKMFLH